MNTLVLVAHPDVDQSTSQQFLLASGQYWTPASYVDLYKEWQDQGAFDVLANRRRLLDYDRIIFQFPLYWYQAPWILKLWIDQVFDSQGDYQAFKEALKGRQLGLVILAGVKASHYQAGGREGRTLSEMLAPYEMLARHFQLDYLPPFAVHQFQRMNSQEKSRLMLTYAHYLLARRPLSAMSFRAFVIDRFKELDDSQLRWRETDPLIHSQIVTALEDQWEEIQELYHLNEEEVIWTDNG